MGGSFSKLFLCGILLFLTACSGGGTPSVPIANVPGGNGSGPPPHTAVSEIKVPVSPLYVAADGSAAYFGFGASGSGSNLYKYDAGNLSQTVPAAAPNGYAPGGGVYGITVTQSGAVYWLSAYYGNQFFPSVFVECGGAAAATLCEPNVDEPTSMLIDSHHIFWTAGITADGGGQIVTSASQTYSSATDGVIQIINGPGGGVWGIVRSGSANFQLQDSIAEFAISGKNVTIARRFPLPAGSLAGSLASGGDGAIWFTDFGKNAVGRMTLGGTLTEYPAPHAIAQPAYGESQITEACDGALWFAESDSGNVARVDVSGAIHEVAMPSAQGYPDAVSAMPPGTPSCPRTVWVGEGRANQLAAIAY